MIGSRDIEIRRAVFDWLDDISAAYATATNQVAEDGEEARREYVTRAVRQRLHQQLFRERVLRAYQERCALCSLRHQELLDAAHITPDSHPEGEPVGRVFAGPFTRLGAWPRMTASTKAQRPQKWLRRLGDSAVSA
jgi:hypothetical protein